MSEALQQNSAQVSTRRAAFICEKIAVYRARSIRSAHFEVGPLCGGINIIYGPNAAGKTTLAHAILTLLWPQAPELERAELVGHFRVATERWRVAFEAGRVRYQCNGIDRELGPLLAPIEVRDRYYLGLRDLLEGHGEGFAAHIARESAGGYDVGAALAGLNESSSKRASFRVAERARAALRDAEAAQEELRREAGLLRELRQQLQRATAAQTRLEWVELALDYHQADALHRDAGQRLAAFSPALAQVRGEEGQQFEALRERAREARVAQQSARKRRDELSAAIAKNPLAPHLEREPGGVEAAVLERVVPTLDRYLLDLERLMRDALAREAKAAEADAKALKAWQLISECVEPSALETISAEALRDISELARRFDRVAGEEWAYKKLRGILTGGNAAESADLDALRAAARQLRGWLRNPADAQKSARAQQAIRWVKIARVGALGAAISAGVASLLGWLNAPGLWPALAVGSIVLVLLFLAITRALSELRAQVNEVQTQAERRDAFRRDFERTDRVAPQAWQPDAVQQRLDAIEQQIARVSILLEKAALWSHEEDAYLETAQKHRALGQERDAIAARLGLNLDLHFGRQYILGFGGEAAELWWLISHIHAWQQARIDAASAAAGLAQARAHFDELLDKFRQLIRPYLPDSTPDAPDIAAAQSQTRALEKAARDLGQNLRERRSAQGLLQAEEARAAGALAETQLLLERLQLDAVPGQASATRDAELARAIEDLCAQRPAYQTAKDEKLAAHTHLRRLRARLERADRSAALLQSSREALEAEVHELSSSASRRDDILSQIARIESRVEDAKKSNAVEQRRADFHAAMHQLSRELDASYRSVSRRVLAAYLQQETRDSTRPVVFRRARELFARITHGRYRLELGEGDAAQFRAFDTLKELAQSLDELSSGTRVQLLLAVRVAFVEQQEQGAKLPLILDETLANSDDPRAHAIIEAVVQIAAEGRQVFYFTAQRDEVQKWQQSGAARRVECKFIDLGALGGPPDLAASAPAPRADWRAQRRALNMPDIPSADGLSHAEYKDRLGIQGGVDPMMPLGSVHLWYLSDAPATLEPMLRAGISRWGALQNLAQHDALMAVGLTATQYRRIQARAKALDAFIEAWKVGRGRPVTRADLEASGAISDIFIDEVADLSDANQGKASALLDALQAGEVKGFRSSKREELAEYFAESGHLDAREVLSDAERWTRVLAAVAPQIAAGVLTTAEVRAALSRAVLP